MNKLLLLVIFLIPFTASAQSDAEYNYEYALIEAASQKMIGNLNEAIKLYTRCIEVKPDSDISYYELGSIYAAFDRDSLAELHLNKAYSLNPKNYWYVLAYSEILKAREHFSKSIKVLNKYLRYEKDIQLKLNLSDNYTSLKKYKKALKILTEIEQENGISELVVLRKVDIFKSLGEIDKGRKELNKLISLFPEAGGFFTLLAEYEKESGNLQEAIKLFEKAFELDSTNIYAITNLADYYNEHGKPELGMFYLSQAFQSDDIPVERKINTVLYFLNNNTELVKNQAGTEKLIVVLMQKYPDNYDVKTLAYDFYNKTGQVEESYAVIKEIIDIKKDNYILWQQLLYNASVLQNHDDVINYGNEALQYFPNKKEINLFIGISLFQKEKYQEAYDRLKSGYREDMDKQVRLQFLTFIAESAFKIELVDSAFAAFEKILVIDPLNYGIMNNYSYYLALLNRDLKKAEEMSKQTIIWEPENSTYLDTYGWVLFVSGHYIEAEKYLKRAVMGSNDPDVLFHYAEVLSKLGKKIEAETYYLKAIEAGLENKDILEKIEGRNE